MKKNIILLFSLLMIVNIGFAGQGNMTGQNSQPNISFLILSKILNSGISFASAVGNHVDKYSDYYIWPSMILVVGLGSWCIRYFIHKDLDDLKKIIKKKIDNINQNHAKECDKLIEERENAEKFAENGIKEIANKAVESVCKAKNLPNDVKEKVLKEINKEN